MSYEALADIGIDGISYKKGDVVNITHSRAKELSRLRMVRHNKVFDTDWSGQSVFVVAPASSLTESDADAVQEWRDTKPDCRKIIAVNNAVKLVKRPDLLVGLDKNFWESNADYTGAGITDGRHLLSRSLYTRLNDGELVQDVELFFNSGRLAIQISHRLGADKIYLLGFDAKLDSDGNAYFYKDSKKSLTYGNVGKYPELMKKAASGFSGKVVNCTRDTALTCFERESLEVVLWG